MSTATAGLYPEPDGTATGGWSGSETSRERAVRERDDGTLSARSRQVYALVVASGAQGVTDPEVQHAFRLGHGASSGALTRLHRQGRIARTTERRNRNQVYVLPEHVGDRTLSPYRPNRNTRPGLEIAVAYLQEQADRLQAEVEEEQALPGPPDRARTRRLLAKRAAALMWAEELRVKAQ